MDVLGIRVDNLTKKEILEKVSHFLNGETFRRITTINPEILLKAQKDDAYKNILNDCDVNIADGTGIKLAFWKKGETLKCRLAGIDLMWEILRIANEKKLKVYLATSSKGLSSFEEAEEAILKSYSHIAISGANIDFMDLRCKRYDVRSDIVFCNFGAPFQEKFLNSLKDAKIKLAVGVGGSFDYLTGKLKRAPKWMQFLGIEWLWRLLLQPKRIKRIFNAVIIFPIKVFFNSSR